MRIHEIITLIEAAYDSTIAAMKKRYPDQIANIDQIVKWAKTILKRQDRIAWYLRIADAYYSGNKQKLQTLVGRYEFTDLQKLATDIEHFMVYPVDSYQFVVQPVDKVIDDLSEIEKKHKEKTTKNAPVSIQPGDKELISFPGGFAWWFVDRAYCPEEGRSGSHCGNVTGKQKTDQRILSFRKDGRVLMTFILEPDGYLGEMKAYNNTKPAQKYHEAIVKLLMLPIVKGIRSGGYADDMNFSIFDLSSELLEYVHKNKPSLIADQVKVTPMDLMTAPAWLMKIPAYSQIAINARPALAELINDSGEFNKSDSAWLRVIAKDPALAVYAPPSIDNYHDLVVKAIATSKQPGMFLSKAPKHVRNNYDILRDVVQMNPISISGVPQNIKDYNELAKLAVELEPDALSYIPRELRTVELAKIAIEQDPDMLGSVPKEIMTLELAMMAMQQDPNVFTYVPKELHTPELIALLGEE